MRFSDFLLVSDPTDLDFIVGYTEEQNIRISVADFFAGNISGSGTPGYVPVFTSAQVIGDSVIFQDGSNIVIGSEDSLDYTLAVTGSFYVSNGAVIDTTISGDEGLRVVAEDGNIFVVPNDLGQPISSLRRINHPPAVLTTESATLGQLNTAISNLEGDIELLLDLKVDKSSVGEPNGVASLDATGKIPLSEIPDSIIGQVEYMGTWNALTNTPILNPLVPEEKGHYYVVSVAGTFGGVDYQVGDWIISNGVYWDKIDNTDAVTSVFGRIGAILALEADYQSFYPRLSQAYDNPTWINTLAFSKITGVPPFLLENQTITLSGDVTGSGKTSILSTISNNAVTDSKLRDSVGTSVIGRASSTTGDPSDIQAVTDGHVLQRSGGTLLFGLISSDSIGSIDWSKIINTPTTLSGYGITDAYTKVESDNKFVLYTGASANVNLGSNNITANAFVKVGGTSSQFLKADGSVDVSQYVPTTRSVNAGTGLTGGGNLSSDITIAFDTNWGDIRYAYRTREIIAGTGLLGGGDLSANRTLSFDTIWGDARYVPYTGATANVDLGERGIRAGYIQLDTTPTSTPTTQGTIYWDQDDNTIDAVLNGYIMKIGEDQFYPVKNQTGASIPKGTAVRFAGTVGASGRLLIQPFIADGSVPSTYFMGVTAETIADGADGKVLWFGRVRGINTTAYNEGDILYASTTVPGGFQTAVPVAPNNIVQVAAVITVHANNGTIFIRPTLGSNINKDEGVKITSPVVGQLLQLQSGNIWENKSLGQVIGGLSSQFLKGDGSLDSTSYVPFGRQITINGTTYDLSSDRVWNVGTVTSVGLSVPVGFAVSNSPITSTGNIALAFDTGYSLPTDAKQLEWDTAYANRIASLTTNGTSGAATFISNVLNIPQYQAQGNYITNLTGEVTADGPGSVVATISNSAVTGKVLTGLSVTGSSILASDTILEAFGKLQGQVNGLVGGLMYEGTWDASTNTPTITSGVGVDGTFYIVSVAGNTTIDGLTDWQVGDWIVFHTPSWQKVDNTESVTSVNGQVGAVSLSTGQIPEGTNLYFTDERSRQSISLTTTGSSGAATYSDVTGVFNIPQYSLSGLGGVPTSRVLTINGVNYDLSADRSWTVGDVRTDSSYANPSWITSLAWGKITGTPTTLAGYGITDAYTQAQVDSLLSGYVTLATNQTITGLKTIVRSGDVLNFKIGTDTLYGLKVAYNQNELVPSGEATWSFVNTFNRNGVGYEVTPLSFFRGVLVTGERLLTSSINSNLLDYYGNNPSGRYPVYAYNTGVQQFSTGILVGYTTGLVNAVTGAISQLPSGVVANFNGRVIGQSAANSNEFVTLSQLGDYVPTSRTLTINGVTYDLSANRSWTITSGVSSVTATSPLFSSGGATPNITIQQSGASASGFLSSTDWNTFNNKANANGSNASGTWGINITGNSATATNISNTGTVTLASSVESNSIFVTQPSYTTDTPVKLLNFDWYNNIWSISNIRSSGTPSNGFGVFYTPSGGSRSEMARFTAGGTFTAIGDVRAPIFYDSNNTGLYLDLNSTSRIVNLELRNNGSFDVYETNNASFVHVDARAEGSHAAAYKYTYSTATGTYGAYREYWWDGDSYQNIVQSGDRFTFSAPITAATDMRAPIFYDSNNTSYYVDAASTSVLNALNVNSILVNNSVNIQTFNTRNLIVKSTGAGDAGILGRGSSDQFAFQIYGSGGDYGFLNGAWSAWDIRKTANGSLFLNDQTTWYISTSEVYMNRVYGVADMRSPIYYDLNNTTYYGDFASISSMYGIAIRGDLSSVDTSNQIFFWGGGNTTTSAIGFKANGGSFTNPTGSGDGYNTYLTMDTPGRGWVFREGVGGSNFGAAYTSGWILNNGIWQANNQMRAPIYFDSNNTGYYVDPSSTTSLRTVGSWRADSSAWDGEFNGKIQYHSNNWYFQAAGDWLFRNSSGTNVVSINQSGVITGSLNGNASTASSASSASLVNGTSGGAIQSWDIRTISPSSMSSYRLGFGFTSWNNNSGAPYADYLHLRSYSDSSGGSDNLITFLKSGIGMRIWQQSFGSGSAYSSYADVLHSSNYSSYALPLSGGTMSGNIVMSTSGESYIRMGRFPNSVTNTGAAWIGRASDRNEGTMTVQLGGNSPSGRTFEVVDYAWSVVLFQAASDGNSYASSSFRAPVFYDSQNTGFYVDPNGSSYLSAVFADDWFRPQGNVGVYWQTWDTRIFSDSSGYLKTRSDNGIVIYDRSAGLKGYLYFDGSGFGLLNNIGGWSVRASYGSGYGGELTGSWTSTSDHRAPVFYDSNDTSFYINPNSGSRVFQLDATSWLRAVNGSVIATGIGGSMTMTASTTTFGAYLRTSGHMVFDQTNTGFNVYVLDGNSVGVVKNAGSQSWSAFSDRTIKTVHSIMDNNLSKLDSITPIYYSFNNFADDKNRIGLIAQEVQEHFPELVEVEPKTQKLTLDYTGLIPVLLGAIKELKTEIETLKTKQ